MRAHHVHGMRWGHRRTDRDSREGVGPWGTACPRWGGSTRVCCGVGVEGTSRLGRGGYLMLTLQRDGCACMATAVAAALVSPGTLLIEAAEVQTCPCLPGDGACSHSACKGSTRWGYPTMGHPRVGPGEPGWLLPPGIAVQMWPQPLLVHLCPRGHCESASHSSMHWPPSLSQLSAGAQPLLSPGGPRVLVASAPQQCSWYLWAQPRTPRRSWCCSTSQLARRCCRPGTGSGACAAGPSTALPEGTARGALHGQGPAQGAGPAHTVLRVGSGLPVLTSGWAGAAHGAAGEAALLLPGTVPVVGAGILLLTRLRWLPRPHPRALAGFV